MVVFLSPSIGVLVSCIVMHTYLGGGLVMLLFYLHERELMLQRFLPRWFISLLFIWPGWEVKSVIQTRFEGDLLCGRDGNGGNGTGCREV